MWDNTNQESPLSSLLLTEYRCSSRSRRLWCRLLRWVGTRARLPTRGVTLDRACRLQKGITPKLQLAVRLITNAIRSLKKSDKFLDTDNMHGLRVA